VLIMATGTTAAQWNAAREALRDSGERFGALITSCDPGAMATRHWSVADTAAHVTTIALFYTWLAQPGEVAFPPPWDSVADVVAATTVDTVNVTNDRAMALLAERDTRMLADDLRTHIDDMLRTSADLDPDKLGTWLGGAKVPVAGLFAHLTNELHIHGRDIARATRAPWETPPASAALFLDVFVRGLIRHDYGRLLDSDRPATRRRIAVEFLSRYTTPLILVLADGVVTVGEPGSPVDVRVRFDPATLNLMLFGRVSRLQGALTGKLIVSGPRPWLLPVFQRTVRFPS
jgi:uncharacterized protein (TIGR03083 family)